MIFFLLEAVGFLISALGARGRLWLSRVLAWLAFDVLRMRRKLVLRNIARVFAGSSTLAERKKIARRSLTNFVLTSLEFFAARRIFPKQKIEIKNADSLAAIFQRGQGVYGMVVHSGNFEMLAFGVSRRFCSIHAPVKPVGKGQVAAWVRRQRAENGMTEIVNDTGGQRSRSGRIFEGLKKNEIVGFMVDQRRSKGLLLPFFGEDAWTNSGLFYLWKQRPAPVVPFTIRRLGLNHHEITVHDEFIVENDPSWKFDEFVLHNTKRMNKCAEVMIASNPEEYFWMHDRWKK